LHLFACKIVPKSLINIHQNETALITHRPPTQDTQTCFLLLWPWPRPDYLDIQTWLGYSECVPAHQKWTF